MEHDYEFVPISNHPNYEINRMGEVRRISTKRLLTANYRDKDGYRTLSIDGKVYRWHRIVAIQFVPNPENKPEVNHINHIRDDNRACNLSWMTRKEQYDHSLLNLENTQQKPRMPIAQYSKDEVFIKEYESITEACRQLFNNPRKNSGNISRCAKLNMNPEDNKHTTAGFIWRRVTQKGSETIENSNKEEVE